MSTPSLYLSTESGALPAQFSLKRHYGTAHAEICVCVNTQQGQQGSNAQDARNDRRGSIRRSTDAGWGQETSEKLECEGT